MSAARNRLALLFVSLAAVAMGGGTLAGCGEKEAPIYPGFAADVAPVLGARCVRCHGAGGTLNGDSDVEDMTIQGFKGMPTGGYFDCPNDRGDCSATGTTCKRGFAYYAKGMGGEPSANLWLQKMPPAPAPALTQREHDIIYGWLANPTEFTIPMECQ